MSKSVSDCRSWKCHKPGMNPPCKLWLDNAQGRSDPYLGQNRPLILPSTRGFPTNNKARCCRAGRQESLSPSDVERETQGLVEVALNGNFHEMAIPIRRISSSGGPRILVGFLICVVEVAPSMLALDHLVFPLCLPRSALLQKGPTVRLWTVHSFTPGVTPKLMLSFSLSLHFSVQTRLCTTESKQKHAENGPLCMASHRNQQGSILREYILRQPTNQPTSTFSIHLSVYPLHLASADMHTIHGEVYACASILHANQLLRLAVHLTLARLVHHQPSENPPAATSQSCESSRWIGLAAFLPGSLVLVSVSQHMRTFAGEDSEGSYQELDVALIGMSSPGFLSISRWKQGI